MKRLLIYYKHLGTREKSQQILGTPLEVLLLEGRKKFDAI